MAKPSTKTAAKSSTANPPFQPPQWPAATVQMWPLSKVFPYPQNARSHPPEQITALAKAMRDDGVTTAILVDEAGVIIYGHGRRLAAIECGFTEYPVMIARGWSETQKRAARVKDNQLGLMSTWNDELLRIELTDLKLDGFDLPLLGFSDMQLAAILDTNIGATDPEQTPAPPKKPIVRKGDLWILGRHRILCGDSTKAEDVARVLDGKTPNLMVTDPPYGVEYDANWRNQTGIAEDGSLQRIKTGRVRKSIGAKAVGKVQNDDRMDWREAWALFPGNVVYCWHAGRHASDVDLSLRSVGFEVRAQIVWDKERMIIGRGDYHWAHEPCWYMVRKGSPGGWAGDRKQTTLWRIAHRASETGHSTQKPIECMKRPIENNSKPGDLVYEPFAGSSTTLIACEMTGRACLAIELDPAYVEVGILRFEAFTKTKATLDGKTLDQVRKARARTPAQKPALARRTKKGGNHAPLPKEPATVAG